LKNKNIDIADLYLEGSDQHRGWFQTSLLESCGLYGRSPYKSVLTHGFVIDDKGKKMSKSLGNVISPKQVTAKYGADVLRIWVASSNFTEDVRISFENLDRHSESYRKIRNTIRFILGNLNGWKLNKKVSYEKLPELEKYILHRLWITNDEVKKMFNEFNFSKAFQIILNFCNAELSAFFFDIRKDSLYCDSRNSLSVNATKTVMSILFENLIRWLSPLIPFTAEEAWQSWREEIDDNGALSCHLLTYQELPSNWNNKKMQTNWIKILELRDAFLFFHEKIRNAKKMKSTMEADVYFFFKEKRFKDLAELVNLSEILICSNVSISDSCDEKFEEFIENENILVKIEKVDGYKCPRCWKTFKDNFKKELCIRCEEVINESF
jgi:isoleucyl-tRNA synthetase